MRIAVCGGSCGETQCLCAWIEQRCAACGRYVQLYPFEHLNQFWAAFRPGVFHGVFLGAGDTAGFLAARRLREEDHACQIILIDDTRRYAVHSYRIHAADFVVRPITRERVGQSVERMLLRLG